MDIIQELSGTYTAHNDAEVLDKLAQLCDILTQKDTKIFEQSATIERQTAVIKAQIEEIHKLKAKQAQFYAAHPKDTYIVEFGNKAWRSLTFRDCISTKAGKRVCDWALTKKTKSSDDFRQYLIDVGFVAE
jgi:Zn-dependent M16 (insulinase) family peptidase